VRQNVRKPTNLQGRNRRLKWNRDVENLNGAHLVRLYDGHCNEYIGEVSEYVGEVGLKLKTVIHEINMYIYEHRLTNKAWVLSVAKNNFAALQNSQYL